ncbi:MAG: MBL fold metallo-hydrolase [bacterium]|nr:MBL fold metallo-hydrolase [bacterium]
MKIKVFPVGSFQSNCIVIMDTDKKKAVVIDPGAEAEKILRDIQSHDCVVQSILLTHGHIDHIAQAGQFHEQTGAPIFLHKKDLDLFNQLPDQARMFGATVSEKTPTITHFLDVENNLILWEGLQFKIIFTPGHSPGSVCFYCEHFAFEKAKDEVVDLSLLLSGDTLFKNSIGRTDLWEGDYDSLIASVKENIFTLPDDTLVIPGHGPQTTVGFERMNNPFF